MISLIPVIEFEPASYSKRTRESPSVTSRDDPQAWELYWRESLEDSGIDELHPHRAGGWYVPVTELTRSSTLRVMLDVAFDKVNATLEYDLPMNELPMLPGGYVVPRQNSIHLYFQQLRSSFSQPPFSRSKFALSVEGSLITAS
jgi:hypothetical protein